MDGDGSHARLPPPPAAALPAQDITFRAVVEQCASCIIIQCQEADRVRELRGDRLPGGCRRSARSGARCSSPCSSCSAGQLRDAGAEPAQGDPRRRPVLHGRRSSCAERAGDLVQAEAYHVAIPGDDRRHQHAQLPRRDHGAAHGGRAAAGAEARIGRPTGRRDRPRDQHADPVHRRQRPTTSAPPSTDILDAARRARGPRCAARPRRRATRPRLQRLPDEEAAVDLQLRARAGARAPSSAIATGVARVATIVRR